MAEETGVAPGLLGRWVELGHERRGASDGMGEADLRAEDARLRRALAEAKMNNELFYQNDSILHRKATQTKKCEFAQPELHKFQYQTNSELVEGVSVWILQMGSYTEQLAFRRRCSHRTLR